MFWLNDRLPIPFQLCADGCRLMIMSIWPRLTWSSCSSGSLITEPTRPFCDSLCVYLQTHPPPPMVRCRGPGLDRNRRVCCVLEPDLTPTKLGSSWIQLVRGEFVFTTIDRSVLKISQRLLLTKQEARETQPSPSPPLGKPADGQVTDPGSRRRYWVYWETVIAMNTAIKQSMVGTCSSLVLYWSILINDTT